MKLTKIKNQNAITLIALVITIIVLLILAGVTLSLIVGEDGMVGRAISASKTYKMAEAKEKFELDVANYAKGIQDIQQKLQMMNGDYFMQIVVMHI